MKLLDGAASRSSKDLFDSPPPNKPGIYAAWIKDSAGLRRLGLSGRPPKLMYVGRAVTSGGLNGRLLQHETAWQPIMEMIAPRRDWVMPLFARSEKPSEYRPKWSGLSELVAQRADDFQEEYFSWTWEVCDRDRATKRETQVLAEVTPILNKRGVKTSKPPLLRDYKGYESSRARWLWHMSWIALLQPQASHWPR